MLSQSRQQTLSALPNSDAQQARIRELLMDGPVGHLRHCLTAALSIHGQVDEPRIRAGLDRIVAHRSALRSVFSESAEHRPASPSTVTLDRRTVYGHTAAQRWTETNALARQEGVRPFQLGETPLVRATLLSAARDRHLLVVVADPLACDAWSANLILGDLLADAPLDSDAYAPAWRARQAWLASRDGSAAVERRHAAVAGASAYWPVPVQPEGDDPDEVVRRVADVDEGTTSMLRDRARQARVSLLAVTAAALALGLAPEAGGALALRSTLAGRETLDEEATVGWFANDAVIVVPPVDGTIRGYLAALRTQIFAALRDQRVPYERVQSPRRTAATPQGPTFSLLYLPAQLSGGDQADLRWGDAGVTRSAVSICPTGADIDLFLVEDPPPMADGARPPLRLGGTSLRARAGGEALGHIVGRWHAALTAMAYLDWDRTAAQRVGRLVGDGPSAGPERE